MKVDLIDSMGSDDRVVDAARVSFDKLSSNYTEEQNHKLLKYLAKNNHFTPFTHVMITVRESVPIFVARQRFKSTVGFTYNEVSRRYVDDAPRFYVPDVWRKRSDNKKQGSGDEHKESPYWSHHYNYFLSECEKIYDEMIEDGVAPEQARMVLPQSMLTEYFCTGSLAAFARAYKLRSEEHSQKEIQMLAEQWLPIMQKVAPVATEALVS